MAIKEPAACSHSLMAVAVYHSLPLQLSVYLPITMKLITQLLSTLKKVPKALFFYVGLSLLLMGPGLKPGFLFLLDMPWPPSIQLSDYTANGLQPHLPITVLIWLIQLVTPNWLVQKLLLITIFTAGGFGMHKLFSRFTTKTANFAYLAGLLFVLNPFVAERLLAGQWLVLAGYAFAPYILLLIERVVTKPSNASWLRFMVAYAILPIVSVHWWYMLSPILAAILIVRFKPGLSFFKKHIIGSLQSLGLFLALNSVWMYSLWARQDKTVQGSDFEAFITQGDPTYGVALNVVALYGFWSDRFSLPKHFFDGWLILSLILVAVSIVGIYSISKAQKSKQLIMRVLAVAVFPALFLAIGYGTGITQPTTEFFANYLPGFKGMRDTAKFIGIIGLFYALFVPMGLQLIATKLKLPNKNTLFIASALVIIAMQGMFWGHRGQILANNYPSGWYSVNTLLEDAKEPKKALILPWQGYITANFANDHFIANPARLFFSIDTEQGSSAGNRLLEREQSALDMLIAAYPRDDQALQDEWLNNLSADHGISHVVLLKTGNWQFYNDLLDQPFTYDDADISLITIE